MNLQQLLTVLRSRVGLILATLATVLALAAAITLIMPAMYTADATVVIDFNQPVEDQPINPTLQPAYLATQVGIISSHNVAVKVVDKLGLAQGPDAADRFWTLQRGTGLYRAFFDMVGYVRSRLKILFTGVTPGEGTPRDYIADMMIQNYLVVTPQKDGRLVEITYPSTDPKFAASVANAFAQAYSETNLQLNADPARKSADWFNKQIADLKSKLDSAQGRLSAYQRDKGLLATDEKYDLETSRLNEIAQQLVVAEGDTHTADASQRQLQDVLSSGRSLESHPEVVANTLVQGLKADLTRQEAELRQLSGTLGPKHPQYQSAAAQVGSLRAQIKGEITNVANSIRTRAKQAHDREAALQQAENQQRAKVMELKKVRDELPAMQREVDSAQKSYDDVLAKYHQFNLQGQFTQTNVEVLNPAVKPLMPSSPNVVLNMALAVFLGIMLGIGFAVLRELGQRMVRSEQDLVESTGVPVLGMLPKASA